MLMLLSRDHVAVAQMVQHSIPVATTGRWITGITTPSRETFPLVSPLDSLKQELNS